MAILTLDVVTPESIALSVRADMVVVPGADGELGILPDHAPLVAALKDGVITIHHDGDVTHRLGVDSGVLEVADNKCVVLAETIKKLPLQ